MDEITYKLIIRCQDKELENVRAKFLRVGNKWYCDSTFQMMSKYDIYYGRKTHQRMNEKEHK